MLRKLEFEGQALHLFTFCSDPKDLFLADDGSSLATSFHIRALSSKRCHIEWPSVLVVRFNSEGLIASWMHYYDDGWNDAQLNCRWAKTPVPGLCTMRHVALPCPPGVKDTFAGSTILFIAKNSVLQRVSYVFPSRSSVANSYCFLLHNLCPQSRLDWK